MSRILFVTSRVPYPPTEGHQLRSWHLLRAAARRHQVDLLTLQREQDPPFPDPALADLVHSYHSVHLPTLGHAPEALRMAGRWLRERQPLLVARYVSGELRDSFRERLPSADLVHIDMLPLAGLMPQVPAEIPVVLNEHNVESLLLQSRAKVEQSSWRQAVLQQQVPALTRFERTACSAADRVLVCSDPDAERLRELAPAAEIRVVPNGVDLEFFSPGARGVEDDRTLVFVGQMSWFPNRDGIVDFMADAFPRLVETHAARLRVIGRHDDVAIPPAIAGNVEFTGFVDDLRPLVREAAVYVVPLRCGSGTRLKVLEAMAMGKAIVSTPIGAEGIELRDGENALLADDPRDFAAAVRRLLDDPGLRRRLGSAARRTAERLYGWDAIGERLLSTYDELLPAAGRRSALRPRATTPSAPPGIRVPAAAALRGGSGAAAP